MRRRSDCRCRSRSGIDSRTLLKRCLLDTVLPALALLSMSVLTVTMIVVVVTTVAHGGWLTPGTYVSVDPWATLDPGPADLREDDIMYPDAVTAGDAAKRSLVRAASPDRGRHRLLRRRNGRVESSVRKSADLRGPARAGTGESRP